MTIDTTSKKSFDNAIAAWNAGDLASYLDMYAAAVLLHGYAPEAIRKPEVAAFYTALCAAFPDARLTIHDELWDADRVAARATMTGTHLGHFNGIPATGISVVLPTITILQFDGPAVIERWSQADMLGLLVQLGAVPAPG